MNNNENYLFRIKGVSFSYKMGEISTNVLQEITFDLEHGSFSLLSGPSGSGKSTLLHLLGLIEPLQRGDIFFLGKSYSSLSEQEANEIRKEKIGFIFQQFHLLPVLTVEENVALFMKKEDISKTKVEEALKAVDLYEHRSKKPNQLSGGQRQRVAIARALIKRPAVILADEPTANLDQKTGRQILDLFQKLQKEEGISFVLSSHDPMVSEYATHIFDLKDGRIH